MGIQVTETVILYCPRHNYIERSFSLESLSGSHSGKSQRNLYGLSCCSREVTSLKRKIEETNKKIEKAKEASIIVPPEYGQLVDELEKKYQKATNPVRKLEGEILLDNKSTRKLNERSNSQTFGFQIPRTSAKTKKDTLEKWGNKCVITGKATNVEVHHLYGTHYFPCLVNVSDNCVPLVKGLHLAIHQTVYDHVDDVYLPITGEDFVIFCENLIKVHKNCLDQISKGERAQGSEAFHQLVIQNCQTIIPQIKKVNQKLVQLIAADRVSTGSTLLQKDISGKTNSKGSKRQKNLP